MLVKSIKLELMYRVIMIVKEIDMVKEIVKDVMFLSQKAEKATKKDKYMANDFVRYVES